MNIYDFSDRISNDDAALQHFVGEYVDHLVSQMDSEEILRKYTEMLFSEHVDDVRQHGGDTLVEDVAREFPEWIEEVFNVDPSLAQQTAA